MQKSTASTRPAAETARHSRRLRSRYRLSDPYSDAELLRILRSIRLRASQPDRMVLIPTSDRYARFLSERREALEADFLFRVPPPAIQTTFLDKRATAELCRRHRHPVPQTCAPVTLEDVLAAAPTFRYPVIIKPSGGVATGFPGKNVVVRKTEELLGFYRAHTELTDRTVFQEFIESGDGHILYVSTYSGADGAVLARCSFRKLRQWLPDRGVTSYGVSETMEGLLEQTTSFLQSIGYVGFTGVEFAEDARTGETFFLELNARAVLPNRLLADAGVDLTAIGYLEMCGLGPPQAMTQRDDVYWIDFQHDIPSGAVRWSRGELSVQGWLSDVWRATSFATWDRHDPRPFLASLARMGLYRSRPEQREAGQVHPIATEADRSIGRRSPDRALVKCRRGSDGRPRLAEPERRIPHGLH